MNLNCGARPDRHCTGSFARSCSHCLKLPQSFITSGKSGTAPQSHESGRLDAVGKELAQILPFNGRFLVQHCHLGIP